MLSKEELAFALVDYRIRNKLNQHTAAKKIGVSVNIITKIENMRDITLRIKKKVIDFLEKEKIEDV